MKTSKKIFLITVMLSLASLCHSQSSNTATSKQYAIGELGWTEQEYKDYLLNKDKKENIVTNTILNIMHTGINPECTEIEIEVPLKPYVRKTYAIPFNTIKEYDHENTTK